MVVVLGRDLAVSEALTNALAAWLHSDPMTTYERNGLALVFVAMDCSHSGQRLFSLTPMRTP